MEATQTGRAPGREINWTKSTKLLNDRQSMANTNPPQPPSFAHQAAKGSWASPIILFLILMFGKQFIPGVILDLVGALFIIAGLALGIVALFGIRRHGSKGILAPAIIGLVINLLLLFIFVTNFIAARAKAQKGAHLNASPVVVAAAIVKFYTP